MIVLATLIITARHGHIPTLMGINSIYFCCVHVYIIVELRHKYITIL